MNVLILLFKNTEKELLKEVERARRLQNKVNCTPSMKDCMVELPAAVHENLLSGNTVCGQEQQMAA